MDDVKFGTSGLRGPADALLAGIGAAHAAAFARFLKASCGVAAGSPVFIGRDLRASSPSLLSACAAAMAAEGLRPVDCGALPTPALALHAMASGAACLMVTGSHIPADRNGLKFYRPDGEITKDDEAVIRACLPAGLEAHAPAMMPEHDNGAALRRYSARYLDLLPGLALSGLRIGIHAHSSVGADFLAGRLSALGADVMAFARSSGFVAVDTEAVSHTMMDEVAEAVRTHRLDAVISTDGDADRPLLADETGRQVRGAALGLMAARVTGARRIVTPVTSNSALEDARHGFDVVRTKVGSPYVIAGMGEAGNAVIGFEANGGVLAGPGLMLAGKPLEPLPTRDCTLPILAALLAKAGDGRPVSSLVADLGLRAAASGRLEHVPQTASATLIARLATPGMARDRFVDELSRGAALSLGTVAETRNIDGLQLFFHGGRAVHVRPSGNAPELRFYAETDAPDEAARLLDAGLAALSGLVPPS